MKKYILKIVVALAVIPFVMTSCLDSDYTPPDYEAILSENLALVDKTQLAADKIIIDDSLEQWGVNGVFTEQRGGVRYTIQQLGTGEKPRLDAVIKVKYKAILLKEGPDGIPFDKNEDGMEQFLYNLIMGWQTALPNFPAGSRFTLYIPSGLAYGPADIKDNNGDIVIPKNSNLLFEIELLAVANPAQ